jgi:uncharacterized SAM-binding protein YcdF (DUF218 family)
MERPGEGPMPVVRSSNNGSAAGNDPPAEAPARRGLVTWLGRKFALVVALIAGVVAVALPAGFFWFVARVPVEEVTLDRNADGIVVLTGGASRINDAIELLASGRGRHLLITGVYPATSPGELSRLMPEYEKKFACCVDLDRSAVNTLGNAIETRKWTEKRGFRSLIIVTSAYHMPRAMAELAHQLPDVALIPFPVVTEKSRTEPWWSHGSTTKLLISEYLKYIVAVVRMRIDPASTATNPGRFSDLHPGISPHRLR